MLNQSNLIARAVVLAGLFAGGILVSPVHAQSPASSPATPPPTTAAHSPYQPSHFSSRAVIHYSLIWGVDSLSVKSTESGEIIRFAYRVLDPEKAKVLNAKEHEPSLIDPQAKVKLVVPALENIGQLRQTGTPEAGKIYWMAFANKGRRVKRGDRVIVVIGDFQADGLVVE
jgi:hypothetical protein